MKGSLTQPVEAADSTDNALAYEVIGNKEDVANSTADEASLVGLMRQLLEGPSAAPLTLPAAAAGATVTAGAAGVAGSYAEIDDGTNVPAVPFRVLSIGLDTPSAGIIGTFEIASGAGGSEAVIAGGHFEVATDAGVIAPIPVESLVVAASTRLAVRLTTVAGSETINASLTMAAV